MAPPTPSILAEAHPQEHFHPRDTLANTAKTTLQTTAVGAIIAGAVNTLTKRNVGPWGIVTKSGGIIALYGMQLAPPAFPRVRPS
jgi:hypothetical protein